MEVGSGNAKSTLLQAIALFCLIADKQISPKVYAVAGSKEQAGIIFEGAKIMVQQNETLSSNCAIHRNSITIKGKYGYGVFKALSADSKLQEGLNPTAVFMDETHVQPNGNMYYNLRKNFPKRQEPLFVSATTAGVIFTFADELAQKARKVKDGLEVSQGFYPLIYAADPEGDDFDLDQLKMANPGWDYLNIDLLMQEMEDAKKSATALAAWRRYHLDKWSGASITWIPDSEWMKSTEATGTEDQMRVWRKDHLSIEALTGRECYLGLDFSSNRDTTAAVYLFPPKDLGERVKVYIRIYIPEASMQERILQETGQYAEWRKHGEVVITFKLTQDLEFIYQDICEHRKHFKILMVAYDAWNADTVINKLIADGVETKAYKQNLPDMNTPMKKLESLVLAGQLEHGGHPAFRWQCSNAQAKFRTVGGSEYVAITKSSDKARIDVMVACIIAIGIWIWQMQVAEEKIKSLQRLKGVTSIQLQR